MAQLRTAQTSELLAEGSPVEVALIGCELGYDNVTFDGVGTDFDPVATIELHAANKAALTKLSTSRASGVTAELRADVKQQVANLDALEAAAADALKEARTRIEA